MSTSWRSGIDHFTGHAAVDDEALTGEKSIDRVCEKKGDPTGRMLCVVFRAENLLGGPPLLALLLTSIQPGLMPLRILGPRLTANAWGSSIGPIYEVPPAL